MFQVGDKVRVANMLLDLGVVTHILQEPCGLVVIVRMVSWDTVVYRAFTPVEIASGKLAKEVEHE